ncbi:MAG: hypothetical protein J0L84_00630 [Verrucomicrobia bacterium]|nr:hypothetical protein [Verrucomicrobiota bacterium]
MDDDIETGIRSISFGPPSHLRPADLIELLRFNGQRRPSVGYGSRITGQASGSGDTPLGEVTANHDSEMGHSGVPSVLSLAEGGGEPGGVILDMVILCQQLGVLGTFGG